MSELISLNLRDSQYENGTIEAFSVQWKLSVSLQAINKLKESIENNNIELYSFGNSKLKTIDENLIWYDYNSANEATFYTSHYIGFYSTNIDNNQINIEILPRFGNGLLSYLLSYAYGIYLPKEKFSSKNDKNNNLWLIAMVWKATLEKALTKSQIPKEYKKYEKNSSNFKGQLNITKHIKHNLVDKSNFYCKYRKLTMDTVINQVIRYTYKLLLYKQKELKGILKNITEYNTMLNSFGVIDRDVDVSEIKNIRYSKLNFHYKKVMELSMLIIKSNSVKSNSQLASNDSFSYFLDVAELWENYLLKVLQKNLPDYEIYSPNESGGYYMIEDNHRKIRPDIIIKKDNKIIAILDAKYKFYTQLGKTAKDGVSRDDLYQMSTYMYHFGDEAEHLVGIFITPVKTSNERKTFNNNKNHSIGVLGLDIKKFEEDEFNLEKIKKEEIAFIKSIESVLS